MSFPGDDWNKVEKDKARWKISIDVRCGKIQLWRENKQARCLMGFVGQQLVCLIIIYVVDLK